MGEGLVMCGGGGGGDCATCCCFGGNCQLEAVGPPNGSFDDPESGRDAELGLKDVNDCCVGGVGSANCSVQGWQTVHGMVVFRVWSSAAKLKRDLELELAVVV